MSTRDDWEWWEPDLTFPAGAEVQFPGCLFPVDVRYVLSLGPPQSPPRPARGSPPPLGLVIGRRRLSRLLEDLFIGGRRGGGVGGLVRPPDGGRGGVDPSNVSHPVPEVVTSELRRRGGGRSSGGPLTREGNTEAGVESDKQLRCWSSASEETYLGGPCGGGTGGHW